MQYGNKRPSLNIKIIKFYRMIWGIEIFKSKKTKILKSIRFVLKNLNVAKSVKITIL